MMNGDQGRIVTRRAALALLPWLWLATGGPGCTPTRLESSGTADVPDRLKKMQALRGTGDPRLREKRRAIPVRQERRPR
jgi:hypothetical protein